MLNPLNRQSEATGSMALEQVVDRASVTVLPAPVLEPLAASEDSLPLSLLPTAAASTTDINTTTNTTNPNTKDTIRASLKASTLDGIFAALFSNVAGGVLLSNFLLELDASAVEIGMLASIPMMVNLIQPLGAYFADRTSSRFWYCLWIYGSSRLLWLPLVLGIGFFSWHPSDPHLLVQGTLAIVLITNLLGALGSASWMSWMAALVPRRLRGRYFGVRNSLLNLTNLICIPLMGLGVSVWPGGTVQGYGALLLFGVIAGLISLGYQRFILDFNPQAPQALPISEASSSDPTLPAPERPKTNILKDANFLIFLLYFGFWTFAVNLSAPFFNLYLLDNLALDVSCVTLYNSLSPAANLLMLVFWGKLADRIGNRPLLVLVGIVVAITPILWLGVGTDFASIWLWLPLLHILGGATWAAIDLCNNNMQMAIACVRQHSTYFAIAAAVAGVSGALGTTVGSLLAQFADYGGLPGLFALSSIVRLVALLPLLFVQEHRSQPIIEVVRHLKQELRSRWLIRPGFVPVRAGSLGDGSK